MTRNSYGNAGKSTIRCPRCAWENHRPRTVPGQTLVVTSCWHCGFDIVVRRDIWTRWQAEREGLA